MAKETVFILSGGNTDGIKEILSDYDYWKNTRFIGVDKGAGTLLHLGYPIDLAIGDFDSMNKDDMKAIKMTAKYIEQYASEKDDTDTQLALVRAMEMYPQARRYILLGTTGGRLDHFLSNLYLPLEERFVPIIEKIYIQDKQNQVHFLSAGKHILKKNKDYHYIAFANLKETHDLQIKNAKYQLAKTNLPLPTSYPSNEFLDEDIELSFTSGLVAVIESKD